MFALEFASTLLFVSLCLFLMLLLLFGFLGWMFNLLAGTLEERWARCVGEQGPFTAFKIMFRASRMRQTKGGRGFKTALAALDTALGFPLLFVWAVALAAAGVYLVLLVLRSYSDTEPMQSDLAPAALAACIYVVYLLSPVGMFRELRWMFDGRKSKLTWPPPLSMDAEQIDPQSRYEAAKALYRLHIYLRVALLSAALTAVMLWSDLVLANEPAGENQRALLIGMIGTAATSAYLWVFNRIVRSRARRWHALDRVEPFLATQRRHRSKQPEADPSGRRRKALQEVAVAAERQAQRLQAEAGAGVVHPTALLLALSVAHLREHLSRHDSVLAAVPPDIEETLARMAVVLAGTSNTSFLARTEARLDRLRDQVRFDAAPVRGPRVSAGLDLTERATALLVKVIVIGLVLWLLVSQQVAAKDLVQMLP
ncbi:hypothetical protein [Glycomyces sp. NPDC048151]|uniref:hypothetical protein n=1 Tax=Glycomyces sp. NPDC048151 TaxID=3364002 RepID=UPI00371AA852